MTGKRKRYIEYLRMATRYAEKGMIQVSAEAAKEIADLLEEGISVQASDNGVAVGVVKGGLVVQQRAKEIYNIREVGEMHA